MLANTELKREDIIAQIRFRDSLYKLRGHAEFSFSSQKMFSSSKRIQLIFGQLQIKFSDKDYCDSIECILSIFQTESPGKLAINYRSDNSPDDRVLKEYNFTFKPDDAPKFHRLVNLLQINGRKIADLFQKLNRRNKQAIYKEDIEAAIATAVTAYPVLNNANPSLMVSECDVDRKGKLEVTLPDLFSLMSTSRYSCLATLGTLLVEWMTLSTQRAEVHYYETFGNELSEEECAARVDNVLRANILADRQVVQHIVATAQTASVFKMSDRLDLLDGEKILSNTNKVVFTMAHPTPAEPIAGSVGRGDASLTNFRLVLIDTSPATEPEWRYDSPGYPTQITIPFTTIARLELESDTGYDLLFVCKDLRAIRVGFSGGQAFASQILSVIQSYAFPTDVKNLFSFSRYSGAPPPTNNPGDTTKKNKVACSINSSVNATVTMPLVEVDGWTVFSPKKEFTRLGLLEPGSPWKLWSDNYTLVPTYPSAFILPSALNESEIFDAADFRSRHRLPALTWYSERTSACLCRSSQPMAGFASKKNQNDKLLLNLYRMRGNHHDDLERMSPSTFYIIDCRSQLAANANAVMGKGVENFKNLVQTSVLFCGVGNIHVMRASLENLQKVLVPWASKGKGVTQGVSSILFKRPQQANSTAEEDPNSPACPEAAFTDNMESARMLWTRIEETGWLDHIRNVLSSSVLVAETLAARGCSVLVHCSDGWDRTAQVSATAQLILDPYFRTLEGFAVLVEKDWCGFGHKFHDRVGHGRPANGEDAKEVSPVFLQWLDVVSQLLFQFPYGFEYSDDLLVFVADSLHACQFGTFLGNSERERKIDLKVETTTQSIWTYVLHPYNQAKFKNPQFKPTVASLWPSSSRVRLWERYFCRWEPADHPKISSGIEWKENWG